MQSPAEPDNGAIDVGPGFLTRVEIEKHWTRLFPSTEDSDVPPPLGRLKPASVDLHLGAEYFVTSERAPRRLSQQDDYVKIPHGEFALLTTHEVVSVPSNVLALISTRVKLKRTGLINISGFHVDPGFTGQIFFSVYNAGPTDLMLKWKERAFTIFFASLIGPTIPYDGQYQNQRGLPPDLVSGLGGPPLNLVKLDQRIDNLEARFISRLGLYGGLASVVFSVLLVLLGTGVGAGLQWFFTR